MAKAKAKKAEGAGGEPAQDKKRHKFPAGRLPVPTEIHVGCPVRVWVDDEEERTGRIVAAEHVACLVELYEPHDDKTLFAVTYDRVRVRLCDLGDFVTLPGSGSVADGTD